MAEYLIQEETLVEFADAIREKTGETGQIMVSDMAGIIRTLVTGGSSGSCDFDPYDENLKYFAYQLDTDNNKVILVGVRYNLVYEDTGSYDITIPDTLGGYAVEIDSLGVV